MRHLPVCLVLLSTTILPGPAAAAVISLASNVDLSRSAYTVSVGGGSASYTFSYAPNGLSAVSMAMSGTGQVYGNGFFSRNSPDPLQLGTSIPNQLSLGEFFTQTGTQPIPYSIALSSVALRFMQGGQTYYGYASVGGSTLVQFAYNDTPGGSIAIGDLPAIGTGAVPEPATWAMLMLGIGITGIALRRRRTPTRIQFA